MYFNGELRQGGDSNHSEIRLLDCAKGGEEFDCCLNAYSDAWEFKGKLRMGARLKVVDDLVNRLIFDLKTPLKVASLYDADDLPRIDIVKALNDAVNLIDFNTADYDTFAASAEAAIDLLDREIYSKDAMDATACCIGHTHIDVAWLWRLRQTREKAGRSFATVLKLMEEYPEYKFMSSQAQLYAFVKEDYPEVYEAWWGIDTLPNVWENNESYNDRRRALGSRGQHVGRIGHQRHLRRIPCPPVLSRQALLQGRVRR